MIYKRCKGHDQTKCRCAFWYVFVLHGVRYRKSTRAANKQVAERAETRRRAAIIEGRDEEDQPKTSLKDHIKAYTEHTKKKNRTAYKDAAVLKRFLESVGDRSLGDVSPFHVERWKSQRAESVARSTVNRELNIVRGCFSRAVEWGRLPSHPLVRVKSFKVDDQRIRVLTDDEIRLVLACEASVALICRVTLECLPRLSEVLDLRMEHFGPTWMEIRRKGGAVARIAITNELRLSLTQRAHASGFIFGEGEKGNPPTEQAASLRITRAMEAAGVKNASHHTCRHTGVTLMLEAGRNPRAIQKLAGWSSLRMLERYGHARDAEIRSAVSGNAAHLSDLTTKSNEEATDLAKSAV